MTDQEKNIAVHESLGWKDPDGMGWYINTTHPEYLPTCNVPDYGSDLNAMHEAEKTLDGNGEVCDRNRYAEYLLKIVHPGMTVSLFWQAWQVAHATAAQRRDAFLGTKGLLKE